MDRIELAVLLAEEVAATRSLLSGLAAPEEKVERFNTGVSEHLDAGSPNVQDSFYSVRGQVAATILDLCRDGQHLDSAPGLADPNGLVWEMVQGSSERISALLAGRAE